MWVIFILKFFSRFYQYILNVWIFIIKMSKIKLSQSLRYFWFSIKFQRSEEWLTHVRTRLLNTPLRQTFNDANYLFFCFSCMFKLNKFGYFNYNTVFVKTHNAIHKLNWRSHKFNFEAFSFLRTPIFIQKENLKKVLMNYEHLMA